MDIFHFWRQQQYALPIFIAYTIGAQKKELQLNLGVIFLYIFSFDSQSLLRQTVGMIWTDDSVRNEWMALVRKRQVTQMKSTEHYERRGK
jgi:hypothetical protein